MLNVLREGDAHGYELKRRAQRPTLSNNSVYPILRRFEEQGMVTHRVEHQEGKPDRKVYAITDAGRRHFVELVGTLPEELARDDDEFLARLSFFDAVPVERRREVLRARAAAVDRAIAHTDALVAGASSAELPVWRALGARHVLDRLYEERRWLDEIESQLDDLLADDPISDPPTRKASR